MWYLEMNLVAQKMEVYLRTNFRSDLMDINICHNARNFMTLFQNYQCFSYTGYQKCTQKKGTIIFFFIHQYFCFFGKKVIKLTSNFEPPPSLPSLQYVLMQQVIFHHMKSKQYLNRIKVYVFFKVSSRNDAFSHRILFERRKEDASNSILLQKQGFLLFSLLPQQRFEVSEIVL